jgi:Asp-tRNA(Asn)/Glu-tRNA(Gln) amidotransferase A subunit family amidase
MSVNINSLLGLIWDVQGGHTQPEAAITAAMARAEAVEPWLHAFRHLAKPAKCGHSGPLRGVPLGIKDIIATAGMPTENGSPVFAGHVPETDAWIVSKIKEFGGTVLGKTVTTEFAWRQPGPTVNPWNRTHTPGGSSSGSAAAVAAGIVPLALGTQTLGSIVRPAAYNGVVGYKPSLERSRATACIRWPVRSTMSVFSPAAPPTRRQHLRCSSMESPMSWQAGRPGMGTSRPWQRRGWRCCEFSGTASRLSSAKTSRRNLRRSALPARC